ncbi:MAG: hypothetical protein IJ060_02375 [Oscillospiraceae bacterium]|nr:hypothetical protein [Oscillospiraceae bacterium]
MKARKAAAVGTAAVFAAFSLLTQPERNACASESERPAAAISIETVTSAEDGTFSARVYLDELPESGLSALEFAVEYDNAALRITEAELLYDTGAQGAESGLHPGLAGTVFTCDSREGKLQVRWGTALMNPEYWLREERALLTLRGTVTDAMHPGDHCQLCLAPADVMDLATGTMKPDAEISAGYLDEEGNAYRCAVRIEDGAVWVPIDETGATMYGDLNLDGQITVDDVVLLLKVIAEEESLCAAAYANADCESDNLLSMADVTLMLRVLSFDPEATALGAR